MALGKRLINTGAAAAACNTDSVQPFGADSTYSSNIALYQLDGNDDDTTGNYNGTSDTGVSYSATGAKFGQAASFNGSSSAIVLPNNILNTNEHSISLWFNLDDTNGIQTVLEMDYENRILFRAVSTDSNLAYIGSVGYFNHGISFSAGQWYHLVITFSAGNPFKIYVDGVLSYTGANSNINAQSNDNILGAANSSGANGVDGKIDQVRIFDKAISAEDVATLYAETSSTASNTNPLSEGAGVALYTLDYDASEASGYYDAEISSSSGLDFGVEGKINTGVRFSANNAGMSNTNLFLDSTAHSVSLWIKPQDLTATRWQIIYFSNHTGKPAFTLGKRPDQTTSFHYRNESSSEVYFTLSNADVWYHIVVTRNNSGSEIFVNGSSVATDSNSMGTTSSSGYNKTTIGSNPSYPAEYFDGTIDQIRVFSKVLDSTEIDTLYNSGNGETACTYTATTTDNNYPTTNLAYYKLDNSAEDEKGSYDGTETDIEYRFGRYGQAAVFNGSSSKIDTGISSISSPFSVSMWINEDSLDSGMFFANWNSTSADMYWQTTSDGRLRISIDGYSEQFFGTAGDVTAKTWHHIAVTLGSGVYEVYLDGISLGTSTTSVTTFSSGQNFMIGNSAKSSSPYPFDGLIDQVRIFSTALSSSQVSQLYNEKPETDTSNFKAVLYEGTGATQYISNVGFQPDLVWIKNRDTSGKWHSLADSVRGGGKRIFSNETSAELTDTYDTQSFEANGFIIGNGDYVNRNNESHVAWTWKGSNADAVSNTTGNITSQVSANTDLGFSIVKYTGDSSATMTVGHGLSQSPQIVISKRLDSSVDWGVYTNVSTGNNTTNWLSLNTTDAYGSGNFMNLSSTLLSAVATGAFWIQGSQIAYCWHSVSGYSKIGSYEGDGTNDYSKEITGLGFDPSFVMVKNVDSSGSNWEMIDTRRGDEKNLYANANYSENANSASSYGSGKFITDGFEVARGSVSSSVHWNKSGDTYLYMAFK